jgi:hypothetical protein
MYYASTLERHAREQYAWWSITPPQLKKPNEESRKLQVNMEKKLLKKAPTQAEIDDAVTMTKWWLLSLYFASPQGHT